MTRMRGRKLSSRGSEAERGERVNEEISEKGGSGGT